MIDRVRETGTPLRQFAWRAAAVAAALLLLTTCVPPFAQVDPPDLRTHFSTFTHNGLRYIETGNRRGPLVLFIHGTPGSWHAFDHLLRDPQLAAQAHLIAVDRPGFGASTSRAVAPLAAQTEILGPALNRHATGGPALLVGHSLGGTIAYQIAADRPDAVAGLVAISSAISPGLGKARWYNHFAAIPGMGFLLPDNLMLANEEIMPLGEALTALGPRLAAIRVPVTIIHGGKDKLVAAGNIDYARLHLTHADLHIVRDDNAGHFLIWEQPDRVIDAIITILATLPPHTAGADAATATERALKSAQTGLTHRDSLQAPNRMARGVTLPR